MKKNGRLSKLDFLLCVLEDDRATRTLSKASGNLKATRKQLENAIIPVGGTGTRCCRSEGRNGENCLGIPNWFL